MPDFMEAGSDLPDTRRRRILELVRARQSVAVEALAAELEVSRETVRRDLAQLDRQGLVRRVHGGAVNTQTATEAAYERRLHEQAEAKRAIAAAAVRLFEPGDSLFVDAGTTTAAFAEALGQLSGLTVVTNSVAVARAIWDGGQDNGVHLIGGRYNGAVGECVGEAALEQIARFRTDHAVITAGAVGAEGVMDFDVHEAAVARAMQAHARSLTVLADHTKHDGRALARVCGLDEVNRLVSDRPPGGALAAALARAGCEVIAAAVA